MKSALIAGGVAIVLASRLVSGQTSQPDSPSPARLLSTSIAGEGAVIRVNASGQALIVVGDASSGDAAGRTFVWTSGQGLIEVRFPGDPARTRGHDLSDAGRVVGDALSPRGLREAFIWSNASGMTLISDDPVMEYGSAIAVNDAGEVIGSGPSGRWSYRWSPATGWLIGSPLGVTSEYCTSSAVAISRWGESVGDASLLPAPRCVEPATSNVMHAYLLRRDGVVLDLGTLGGAESHAAAINDRGQVAGWSRDPSGASRAFIWSAATGMASLGTLGGRWSEALAINNLGQIAGVSATTSGDAHGFFWSGKTGMLDLGPGRPSGLNDLGQVVGSSVENGESVAYLWSVDGGRIVLASDARALDVNNRGEVGGASNTRTGPEYATLWRVALTPGERLDAYEAKSAVQKYGGNRTAEQVAGDRRLLADARRALANGDAAGVESALLGLSAALDEPSASVDSLQTMTLQSAESAPVAYAAESISPGGAVYNVKVVSDSSPDLSDLNSLIQSTTSRWTATKDKVWALFYWTHMLKRQTPPMVLHGLEVTDPIRNFSDFGFTMCSTISGINQSLFGALGLGHQYWDICNHTVSAVDYDGKFHMIDSSMSQLVTNDDGVTLASVAEAAADSARLVRQRNLYSTSANGFLTGSDTMRNLSDFVSPVDGSIVPGFARDFCADGLKYRDYYYNWDSGHRYVLNLRDNDSYTRYYHGLGTTSDYWVASEKVSGSDPAQAYQIDPTNKFGVRGNGRWIFTPGLSSATWSRGVYRATHIMPAAGGLAPDVAGQTAEVVYKISAANAITSQKIDARFARVDLGATATIAVSVNHGTTWKDVGTVGSTVGSAVPVVVNLRGDVTGAYETLIRVRMTATSSSLTGVALTGLTITTLTHLNTKALPALKIGRNEVAVDAGDQSDSMVLWPELRGGLWARDAYDSRNVGSQDVTVPTKYSSVVYPKILTEDAYLTYRMVSPTDITRVVYGGRLHNYRSGSYIDFLHSFDGGTTWVRSYRLSDVTKPYDVIHYETVADIPPGVRTVLFKFLMHNTNTGAFHATGLFSLRMEADRLPANEAVKPLDVTFRWKEVQSDRSLVERTHRQRVATFPFNYVINVGGRDHPVMESLRVNVEDLSDTTPYGYGDGSDAGGVKYVPRKRTEGTNVAERQRYTVSRAPSGFQGSPGAGNTAILTDGVVGAPMTGGISYWWGQCWSAGADLDLQVDLGQTRTVSGFRAHLFGYPFWDALKGQVQDRVEIQTSLDGATFASRGVLQTSLWRKDIPINYMLLDLETATGWNFELTTGAVSARYVRYHITPKRTLCISELQVFDRIDYAPFDVKVALPSGDTPPPATDTTPPAVSITAPADGATVAGSVALAATATDNVGVANVTFLVDGTAVATDTTAPYAATWNAAAVANGAHTISARATDAAGNAATAAPVGVTVANPVPPPAADDIVLYAAQATTVAGAWRVEADATAAGGRRLRHPDGGAAKRTSALSAPIDYFELTFTAEANVPYHLWLRARADANAWANDSVFVQLSHVADYPIGTTTAAIVTLEDCTGCGVAGWGWQDTAFAGLAPPVVFTTGGAHTLRIQTREDGLAIDQIILSPARFLTTAPGALKNDMHIYPPSP